MDRTKADNRAINKVTKGERIESYKYDKRSALKYSAENKRKKYWTLIH